MAIDTKSKYNVAFNNQGFLLEGLPDRPAYLMEQSPVYGTRFASGDRDYNDLSAWWYLTQTDWQGGITDNPSWEDTATYYYSSNIDVLSQPGSIQLEQATTTAAITNTTAAKKILYAKHVIFTATTERLVYIDVDDIRIATDDSLVYSNVKVGEPSSFELFGDELWIGHSSTSSTSSLFVGHTLASAFTDITSYVDSVVVGNVRKFGPMKANSGTMYVPVIGTNAFVIAKSTVELPSSGADFTALVTMETIRSTAEIAGFEILGGSFICAIEDSNIWTIFEINIATGAYSILYQTEGDSMSKDDVVGGKFITKLPGEVIITIPDSNGIGGRIYSYNGSTFQKIFSMSTTDRKFNLGTNESQVDLSYGSVVFNDKVYWGNLVYDGSSFYNFIKNNDGDTTINDDIFIPIGVDASEQRLLLVDVYNSGDYFNAYRYVLDPIAYKTEGFLVFTNHDIISGIDKLLNSVTIGFNNFASGQAISIYYMTDPNPGGAIAGWTLLGTASFANDGASIVTRTFPFPSGTVGKKIWFRAQLASTAGSTPVLNDFTLEYLPIPDYRKQWTLNLNLSEVIKRLDGEEETRKAREMAGFIERLWLTKSTCNFQDINYAATTIKTTALTDTATTIVASDTTDFPEYGRLLIESEEIFYTSKDTTHFYGCTRARQGTRAVAHATTTPIYAGLYRVLITAIQQRVPVLQKDKEIESTMALSIREVGAA